MRNSAQEEAVKELETRLQKSVQTYTLEQDEQLTQKEQHIQSLYRELDKAARDTEAHLLSAETTKQQALTLGQCRQPPVGFR